MIAKRKRLWLVVLGLTGLALMAALILNAFNSLVFFYAPSDLARTEIQQRVEDRRFTLGGLVEPGSVSRLEDEVTLAFVVTDNQATTAVQYKGLVPDLFAEGKGVVAKGKLNEQGVFIADEVLAKHDENYMSPEVAEKLESLGHPADAGYSSDSYSNE